MNKKLYISKRIKGVSGRVDYYLTESRYNDVREGISTFVFGVEICKTDADESGTEYVQKNRVSDLSVCREMVIEFLYLLAENDVLPISLKDVAEDFTEDGFFYKTDVKKKTA